MHVSSGYSARYGGAHPEALVRRAAELGMGALALTDRDTVGGVVRFATACAEDGVRPVLGVDMAVAPYDTLGPQARRKQRRSPVRGGAHVPVAPLRVTLLARDGAGWAGLCRLVSSAHADTHATGGVPVVGWDALGVFGTRGLTVLLGPVSEPVRALAAGRPDVAERLLAPWRELFGSSLRLEAVYYGLSGTGPGSLRLAARTVQLADRTGIKVVLSNAVRYAVPGQHRVADVLDAARLLRPVDFRRPGRLDPGERWLKGPDAMTTLAGRVAAAAGLGPDRARDLIAETVRTGEQCRVDPVTDLGLGRTHLPEPHTVGAPPGPGGAARLLRERCEAGMARRGLDRDAPALQRLDEELEVIGTLGFDTYFLTVAQVVADAREMGVRVAARGSGAGSMVNHALGIATANPLEHHLLFERFLSLRRTGLPDIDIDVESARRLDVYRRVFDRFGPERVAVIGMPETYRARHALRDTALALGIEPQTVDRIAKSFPHIRASDITSALAELPELRDLAGEAGRFGPLFKLAEQLDALPRSMAMHPCGVIISDATLLDRLPVQPTPGGQFTMVQAAKWETEALGHLKLDILGVRMQSAMAHAVDEIERVTGRRVDLDDPQQVPLDDYFAFKLIQASRTIGIFQLESPGQQDLLSRLQPRGPQDVIADISLFRPGPVAGGMPERYIAARHGEAPRFAHPDLEPVLADTYGVTIWHEQIIDTIATLTGCERSLGEIARRALGDEQRLPALRDWFHERAAERGYSPEVRAEVWQTVEAFGAYGFCRAHAVAFAVPALQSAWLKAHHPAALLAGLLEHDPGMWPKRILVAEWRRHHVQVLGVDVNHSDTVHRVEGTPDGTYGVRLALSGVKGISTDEAVRLAAGRPYTSLQDLWQRARPSLPTATRLASIGALAPLAGPLNRRDLLLHLHELHRHTLSRRAGTGQLPLDEQRTDHGSTTGLPPMTGRDMLGAELDVLGIDVTQHLMESHHRLLAEIGAVDSAHLPALHPGRRVLVAGVRASTQTPPIRSGRRIIFVTLEDGYGLVDVAFFEDSHPACAHTVFHSGLLLVAGTVQRRGRRNTLVGTLAWDLEEIAAARRDHGPEAVLRLLGEPDLKPTPPTAPAGPRRTIAYGTAGAELHPWADLKPACTRSADVTKLGTSAGGPR
ncbi:DNA polymerase III subunit alpha [Streptomyces niveus]|uniref:DNA polymerase III subunit alpha n=1 Tax=Streptomyces niveus TaxID=193462 RepID=UPI00366051AF